MAQSPIRLLNVAVGHLESETETETMKSESETASK